MRAQGPRLSVICLSDYLNVTRGGADSGANHQEAGRGDGGEGEPHAAEGQARAGAVRWRELCLGVRGAREVHVSGL